MAKREDKTNEQNETKRSQFFVLIRHGGHGPAALSKV